jgi:hypothetical protein
MCPNSPVFLAILFGKLAKTPAIAEATLDLSCADIQILTPDLDSPGNFTSEVSQSFYLKFSDHLPFWD